MTTITIKDKNIKLSQTSFLDINELLTYLLSFWTSKIEFENFTKEENIYLENRSIKIKKIEDSINSLLSNW